MEIRFFRPGSLCPPTPAGDDTTPLPVISATLVVPNVTFGEPFERVRDGCRWEEDAGLGAAVASLWSESLER